MPNQPLPPNQVRPPRPPIRLGHWLKRWQGLTWGDRAMLIEALTLLGVARATVLMVPFRRIAPHLGHVQQETATGTPTTSARRVANAIYLVSRYTPWHSNCFAQALAGHVMLRRRHSANTLYLGVQKKGEVFSAHAWLRDGDMVVTGGPGHQDFSVIARYAWQPSKSGT